MTLTVTPPAEDHDASAYAERLRAATRDELTAMLCAASESEALTAVNTLGLRELYELPREIVEAWPGDPNTPGTPRFDRARRLTTERWVPEGVQSGMWRINDIARAVNVQAGSVSRWRTNMNNGVGDVKRCLPRHTDSIGEVKEPGDRRGEKGGGGIPLFEPSVILEWLKWAGKVTDDLYPHNRKRGGGIPTGRPPAQRRPED